jgi:WD40 repeat protein/tRNA A-37 threonylcarbamoyl transferase component Bud32
MTLSASQMATLSRLLDEALPLDATDRLKWLAALRPEYEEFAGALRRALLPGDETAARAQLLTLPEIADDGGAPGVTETGLVAGVLLGPYELIRPLGSGGMAEVWLARRADGAFNREVALKLPLLTRLRRDLEPRFAREREILAGLSHPNIARLFDAGFSKDGQPYLALEYVVGTTLTAYCDQHLLTIRERLNLFRQVLSAVQYAHTHLVIHRDLKPSNVLVTDAGQVQLLDFGIAKLLSEGQAKETELTQLSGRALTPEYAAPEQVLGAPITTAADVYALGVMLYEVLTGSRPYRLTRDTRGALEEAILHADPVAPSRLVYGEAAATARGASAPKLSRALKGDLDVITMKALKKTPKERYPTANALDEDIERFLAGQVVLAQPDSMAYRAGKFARRHWVAIATLSVLILTLAGGLAATSYEARVASAERDVARQAQLRVLTQAAAGRMKEGDVSGAMGIVLEVLSEAPATYTPEALRVFQETRAADGQIQALIGHTDRVFSSAWSRDGRRIVTASGDNTARIWDEASGQELLRLRGHTDRVQNAQFSPDGRRVATASWDNTARVWDAATGQPLLVLAGHGGPVETVAFSSDGQRIVTASRDSTVRIWNSTTGQTTSVFRGHTDRVYSAVFSSDGQRVATASADETARVWDSATARQLAAMSGHSDAVYAAAFSPDDRFIVTASADRTARIWDTATGAHLLTLRGHADVVLSADFSPDGRKVVTASADRSARIWDAKTGELLQLLTGHTSGLYSAAFSPDSRRIVTASDDRTARTWDVVSSSELSELRGHTGVILGTAFSRPEGGLIATASADHSVRIWDAVSGIELRRLLGSGDSVNSVEFSPDGKRLASASFDATCRIWDVESGKQLLLLRGEGPMVGASFSPDGRRLVTASYDNSAAIWDIESARRIVALKGHVDRVETAAFSPDGKKVVTASDDRTAVIWDAATGRQILQLRGHTNRLESAAFSPDGHRVITAANDDSTRIWDAETGQMLMLLTSHTGTPDYAGFSPDGERFVTTADDGIARIWEAKTGRQLLALSGHTARVEAAAFSPDGQRLVTASDDKTARIWDIRTSELGVQIAWARAAQFDGLEAEERFELGLAEPPMRQWPRQASRCDEMAAAPYDPDRLQAGVELERIVADTARQACAVKPSGISARGDYQRGRVLLADGQYAQARAQLEKAVAEGYRSARIDLARLLLKPLAGMIDAPRAISLYEDAWKSGVTIAAFELGGLFEHGIPSPNAAGVDLVVRDWTLAWAWYRKGVEASEPHALGRLADEDLRAAARGESSKNAHLLDAFALYAMATERARFEGWRDEEWQVWRYRRASLARMLARQSMTSAVAARYLQAVSTK